VETALLRAQDGADLGIHGDVARAAGLRAADGEHVGGEVGVDPAQGEELAAAEARVKRERYDSPGGLTGLSTEAHLFDIGEIADPGIVLREELHLADRIRLQEPVGDRHVVGTLEEGELTIDAGGSDLGEPLRNVALHVARHDLTQRPVAQRRLPHAAMPLEVRIAPERAPDPGEVVADEVR
jgi:hypothetical protein